MSTLAVHSPERHPAANTSRLFVFALLATVFDGAEIMLVTYFMPALTAHYQITHADLVRILFYQNMMSLAGGIFFGWLGDRYGRRWTLVSTVALYGLGTVWAGFAPSLGWFTVSRVVAGLGIGGEFGAAFAIFNEIWSNRSRGWIGSWVQNMFVVGMVTSTVVSYLSLDDLNMGWQGGFLLVGAISLAIAVATYLFMPESSLWRQYDEARRAGTLPPHLRTSRIPHLDLFRGGLAGHTIKAALMATGIMFLSYAVLTFLPDIMFEQMKIDHSIGTQILLWIYLGVFLGSLTAGRLADSIGRKTAVVVLSVCGLIGYIILVAVHGIALGASFWGWPLFWAIMVIFFGNGAIGVLGVWLGELYPTRLRTTGENFCYYAGRGIGASLLPWVAVLIFPQDLMMAMILGLAGAVLAVVFGALLPETRGREIQAVE